MLTNEVMGLLALGILWVNTLLVAGAAWQQARALLARRAALGEGLWRARVARGDGPGGALAAHRITQVGRAAEGGDAILFHDRTATGEVSGGALEVDGVTVTLAPLAEAEVWVGVSEVARAAACASATAFDEAFAAARKARGFTRTFAAEVTAGQTVFVHGRIEEHDGARTLAPPPGGTLLVATMDPRALLGRHAALAIAFLAGEVLLAAACTAVALWPPAFGRVSTVGGALCLLFFLLVQPAGTAVRDAVLVPSRTFARGAWKRAATA